jgi:hypothetical protein
LNPTAPRQVPGSPTTVLDTADPDAPIGRVGQTARGDGHPGRDGGNHERLRLCHGSPVPVG